MQCAGADAVLAGSDDDVFLSAGLEVIGVAEVVAESRWAAVDDDALLLPSVENAILGRCLHDGGPGVVDGCIEHRRRAASIVGATAPAALDVVALTRGDGYGFLAPVVEICAGEMTPMEASHVGAVGILLEEHMIAAVGVEHAVALVHPAARRHCMELRAPKRAVVTRSRIVEVRSRSPFLIVHCQ